MRAYFNFNKLNYKMQRGFESSTAHTEMLEKLQNMFPHINLPMSFSGSSLSESLNVLAF